MKPCPGLEIGLEPPVLAALWRLRTLRGRLVGYVMNKMGTGIDPNPRDVKLRLDVDQVLAQESAGSS